MTVVPSYNPPSPGPLAFLVGAPGDAATAAQDRANAIGGLGYGPLAGRSGWRHDLICEAIGLDRTECYHGSVFQTQYPRLADRTVNLGEYRRLLADLSNTQYLRPADRTIKLGEYRRLLADLSETPTVATSPTYRSRLRETCAVPVGGRYLPPSHWPELVRCWIELERLAALGTRVVVLYGETPLWAVLGKTGIKPNRGHVLRTGFGDLLALATYHPGDTFTQQTALALVVEDVRKAWRVATGQKDGRTEANEPRPAEPIVLVPETASELRTALETYVKPFPGPAAWDLETPYPHEGVPYEIRCIQVCADGRHAIVIPFVWEYDRTRFYRTEDEAEVRTILAEYLTNDQPRVFQKGQFDASVLLGEWGVRTTVDEDTLLMLHADNPSDSKDLSSGCARWLHVSPWKDLGRRSPGDGQ